MNSNIRIITAALVFIVLAVIFVLLYNTRINNRKILSDGEQIENSGSSGTATVFIENNLYGVMNSEEEVIIEPEWDFLYSPAKGRYIVGESKHGIMYYGALDEKGNISIPVVYESIDVFNSEILAAKTFEGKYAIYDIDLRSFSHEEYSDITENIDGSYEIAANGIIYTVIVNSKNIYIKKLSVICNIDTFSKYIDFIPSTAVTYDNAQNYVAIATESAQFINALFYGNSDGRYSYKLLDDSILLGENPEASKAFGSLESITPEIIREEEIKYECCVSFSYSVLVADSENPDEFVNNMYEVNAYLTMQKDFEGNFKTVSCVFSNS